MVVSLKQPALVSLSIPRRWEIQSSHKMPYELKPGDNTYAVRKQTENGLEVEYRRPGTSDSVEPSCAISVAGRSMRLASRWSASGRPEPLVLEFDPSRCHATLLGRSREDGSIDLPAILHLPDQGSVQIRAAGAPGVSLLYDAQRADEGYVRITFPRATEDRPVVEYLWEVVAIHPQLGANDSDVRFTAFRRNWLNIFQWNPRLRVWRTIPRAIPVPSACTSMPISHSTRRP